MKKGVYSKAIVSAIILLNILFTIAVLYASIQNATIPDSLIVAWFAFTTGELSLTAFIKKKKIEKEESEDE